MVNSPWLNEMLFRREMDPALVDVTHHLRYLADADVRYVILHKNFVSAEKIKAWKDWLTFTPVFEDGITVAYRTAPQAGIDFVLEHTLTPELGVIRAGYETEDVQQGQLLPFDIRWGTTGEVKADYDYCINLVSSTGETAQQACYPISPDWPTSRWLANEVARSTETLRIDPFLPPAEYRVLITLRDSETLLPAGEAIELDTLAVTALPRTFTPPAPEHAADALLGEDIRLYGYDVHAAGNKINLVLYWGAERRLDRSYKVFVHAVDAASGVLVAQVDAVPRNWSYPTTWWEAGEVVADPIELSLPGTGGTQVVLLVGLYDELTGARLPFSPAPDAGAGPAENGGDAFPIVP
jgi:hypothetical protein